MPGVTPRPSRSIDRVFSPMRPRTDASLPTRMIRFPRTASADARGCAGSIVMISPPNRTRSAGASCAGVCAPPQPSASASALVGKADRQIDLVVTPLETIPKIEAEQGQHDLPHEESASNTHGVLERRQAARLGAGEVITVRRRLVAVEER